MYHVVHGRFFDACMILIGIYFNVCWEKSPAYQTHDFKNVINQDKTK